MKLSELQLLALYREAEALEYDPANPRVVEIAQIVASAAAEAIAELQDILLDCDCSSSIN